MSVHGLDNTAINSALLKSMHRQRQRESTSFLKVKFLHSEFQFSILRINVAIERKKERKKVM